MVEQAESNSASLTKVENLLTTVHSELQFVKGVLQKHDKHICSLKERTTDHAAKHMANDIVISGLEGDSDGENCPVSTIEFFKSKLKVQLDNSEVLNVYRQGTKFGNKPRSMVVRCAPDLRSRIFKHTKNLQGVRSPNNSF